MVDLAQIEGFDWDEGNERKSLEKHSVSQSEAEQLFFSSRLFVKTLSLSSSGEVILGVPFLPQQAPPSRRHGLGGSGHRAYQWRYGFRSAFPSSHLGG